MIIMTIIKHIWGLRTKHWLYCIYFIIKLCVTEMYMWSDKKLLNYDHAVKVKKMFIISFDCTTVVLPKYIYDLFINYYHTVKV